MDEVRMGISNHRKTFLFEVFQVHMTNNALLKGLDREKEMKEWREGERGRT